MGSFLSGWGKIATFTILRLYSISQGGRFGNDGDSSLANASETFVAVLGMPKPEFDATGNVAGVDQPVPVTTVQVVVSPEGTVVAGEDGNEVLRIGEQGDGEMERIKGGVLTTMVTVVRDSAGPEQTASVLQNRQGKWDS